MTTIAILGATGHIAKGLISEIARQGRFGLILYSRRPKLVDNFLVDHSINRRNISVRPLQTFGATPCDVIINTIGAGDPKAVRDMGEGVIDLTAKYDDLVLSYLKINQNARYIFLSSGAVYGNGFGVLKDDFNNFPCAQFTPRPDSEYARAKVIAETKHRLNPSLNIIDLRIFGYFSRYIDVFGEFFLAQVSHSILYKKEFLTDSENMVRDYCVPQDFWRVINVCLSETVHNMAIDVYSLNHIDKFSLLETLKRDFGLNYTINENEGSHTKIKGSDIYYSESHQIEFTGFKPQFCSIEGIVLELTKMIGCE